MSAVRVLEPSPWHRFHVEWDLAIGGNTSAHLNLLHSGVPTLYASIDHYPLDYYGFVEDGLICAASGDWQGCKEEVNQFYQTGGWSDRYFNWSKGRYSGSDGQLIQQLCLAR